MGKTVPASAVPSDRVQAARARLEQLRQQQGVPEFDWNEVSKLTCRIDDETDEEFDAFLREIRSEGTPHP